MDRKPPKTRDSRISALEAIGDFIVEQVREFTAVSKSPVKSGKWVKALSKEYAKKAGKKASDLRLDGDLMASLVVNRKGNKLVLTVPDDQQGKADGHSNHSGRSRLPAREFIPKEGGGFRGDIETGIKEIIREFKTDG